mmetsp:Transcript_24494/g.78300  ORF Transcript_24494/g.78300 Transcript_24494/m.78300 type:complete len:202 (-) Transcript_24494:254-859(-)
MRRLPHGRRRRIEAREPPRRQQTPRPLKLHLERVPLRHEAIALEQGGIPLNGELTPLCRSAVSGSCERLPGLRMRLDLRLKRNHHVRCLAHVRLEPRPLTGLRLGVRLGLTCTSLCCRAFRTHRLRLRLELRARVAQPRMDAVALSRSCSLAAVKACPQLLDFRLRCLVQRSIVLARPQSLELSLSRKELGFRFPRCCLEP